MRRFSAAALVAALLVAPASASAQVQTLKQQVNNLFRFGECGEALCLAVNADVHGLHYAPSATQASGALINFFADAIGAAVSNLPISSSSGGVTFSFKGGRPVKTSTSSGPIFAERGQTIGRGQLLTGANVTSLRFATFRGLPLDQLDFNFVHQNVGSPVIGDPAFENDVINVRSSMDLNILVTTAFVTYGLLDRLDIGLAVPLVRASLDGTSHGTMIPFGPNTPHLFGTTANPSLTADGSTSGSSVGLGDVAVRMKANLAQTPTSAFALFGDVRLPTGDENNFRGAGALSARVLGAYSGRYRAFSPHINAGYLLRSDTLQSNAIVGTAGFDQLINDSWTGRGCAERISAGRQQGAVARAGGDHGAVHPQHYAHQHSRRQGSRGQRIDRGEVHNGSRVDDGLECADPHQNGRAAATHRLHRRPRIQLLIVAPAGYTNSM